MILKRKIILKKIPPSHTKVYIGLVKSKDLEVRLPSNWTECKSK